MFGNKRKIQELNEALDQYRTRHHDDIDRICKINTENDILRQRCGRLEEQNTKLINWVEKIVNQLGYYEVNSKLAIQLPVFREQITKYNSSPEARFKNIIQDTIVLPEITIQGMTGSS